MKWVATYFFLFVTYLVQANNSKFSYLLQEFDMKNPIIVGSKIDLKNKEMFDLMKKVMKLNQSISLIDRIRNGSLQQTPGIIMNPTEKVLSNKCASMGESM